jgi:hypothetical protein
MKKILLSSVLLLAILAIGPVSYGKNDPADQDDKGPLEKITFIHYKKNQAKLSSPAKSRTPACYTYIANGAKWKTVESYAINSTNNEGMTPEFISSAMGAGVSAWETAAGINIFGNAGVSDKSIMTFDGENITFFAPYSDPGVIAVTTIWGYFSNPKTRQIVEWDMQFNSAFEWGNATADSSKMDLQNIATHELGHSAGMGDLYTTSCTSETMYGYSTEGDLIKRTLNTGDIAGIKALY